MSLISCWTLARYWSAAMMPRSLMRAPEQSSLPVISRIYRRGHVWRGVGTCCRLVGRLLCRQQVPTPRPNRSPTVNPTGYPQGMHRSGARMSDLGIIAAGEYLAKVQHEMSDIGGSSRQWSACSSARSARGVSAPPSLQPGTYLREPQVWHWRRAMDPKRMQNQGRQEKGRGGSEEEASRDARARPWARRNKRVQAAAPGMKTGTDRM